MAVKVDRQLKGQVYNTFNRDQTKTQSFISSFDTFLIINEDNNIIKIPYKCCTFFLGLFNGPKVDD
jgi:hypothetical protein